MHAHYPCMIARILCIPCVHAHDSCMLARILCILSMHAHYPCMLAYCEFHVCMQIIHCHACLLAYYAFHVCMHIIHACLLAYYAFRIAVATGAWLNQGRPIRPIRPIATSSARPMPEKTQIRQKTELNKSPQPMPPLTRTPFVPRACAIAIFAQGSGLHIHLT